MTNAHATISAARFTAAQRVQNPRNGGEIAASAASLSPNDFLRAAPVPRREEELWRYSRINEIGLGNLSLPEAPSAEAVARQVDSLPAPIGEVAAQIVTLDGTVIACRVSDKAGAAGLVVELCEGDESSGIAAEVEALEDDVFASLTSALAAVVVKLTVAPRSVVEGVVQLVHLVSATSSFVPVRLVVNVGDGAELSVVERVQGSGPESIFAPVTDLNVAPGGHLRFVTIQELGVDTHQFARQRCVTGRDATLRSMAVALGGSYARMRTDAVVAEQGAFNELLAVYFGAGSQMHDFRTLQHHVGPRTTSELLFKGAVQDHAQSVYSGLIRIGVDARNAVANQANRNLLLSPTASVESVPNLEIENNEVKCSHASAVGPVDEDHRYYLELRGVPPVDAERLIVQGFFADVLDRSPVAGVSAALADVFARKFAASVTVPA